MCTLIALHRRIPGAPLLVAANRDEYFERPTEGPALRATPSGPVLAPKDLRAGGAWLGLNGSGVFAAVTNRSAEPDPRRRSRGGLVMEALAAGSAAEAASRLGRVRPQDWNAFTLFVADRDDAYAITCDESVRSLTLTGAAVVLGNADPTAPDTPKIARLRSEVARAASAEAGRVLDDLGDVCRSHAGGGLGSVCVHLERFGTRSSTLLRVTEDGEKDVLLWADGPPCTTPYEDLTPLLGGLASRVWPDERERAVRRVS